jgi:uncharacterized protein with HEPN domain
MSQRSDKVYLRHILDAVVTIQGYIARMDQRAFGVDKRTQDAVIKNLIVIGEAAAQVSAAFRKAHPHLPWSQMIGMRNILVHHYFGVNRAMCGRPQPEICRV